MTAHCAQISELKQANVGLNKWKAANSNSKQQSVDSKKQQISELEDENKQLLKERNAAKKEKATLETQVFDLTEEKSRCLGSVAYVCALPMTLQNY